MKAICIGAVFLSNWWPIFQEMCCVETTIAQIRSTSPTSVQIDEVLVSFHGRCNSVILSIVRLPCVCQISQETHFYLCFFCLSLEEPMGFFSFLARLDAKCFGCFSKIFIRLTKWRNSLFEIESLI